MAVTWKELKLFKTTGGWITLATATLIGVGTALWYERPMPLYPTAQDEAEVRFAMLERLAVRYGFDSGFAVGVTTTVGFYPSRSFFYDETYGYGAPYISSVPTMLRWLCNDGASTFVVSPAGAGAAVDYWGDPRRSVADYPTDFYGGDLAGMQFDLAWWQSNMYVSAGYFGDFAYLNLATNTARAYYIYTNMLWQVGRVASAMRWVDRSANRQHAFKWSAGGESASYVWYGDWAFGATRLEALDRARLNCIAAGPHPSPPTPEATATNMLCLAQYVLGWVQYREDSGTNYWLAYMNEYASFDKFDSEILPSIVPAADDKSSAVLMEGVVAPIYTVFGVPVEFYCPFLGFAEQELWQVRSVPVEDLGGGMMGVSWTNSLFKWRGRFGAYDYLGAFPTTPLTNDYDQAFKWMGYESTPKTHMLLDMKFQCLTNRAAFWP